MFPACSYSKIEVKEIALPRTRIARTLNSLLSLLPELDKIKEFIVSYDRALAFVF